MPKISAPTLAQHRAARERALLDAAHELLLETGEAPCLPQVASRAGLARTSAYQYFGSKTSCAPPAAGSACSSGRFS